NIMLYEFKHRVCCLEGGIRLTVDFVFADKDDLVKLLYKKLSNPTQIKVQKTLYLLFAYYGATYGKINNRDTKDDQFDEQSYPKYLFNADFQAWRYGPVERDVYSKEKNDEFNDIPNDFQPTFSVGQEEKSNILSFIDNIINQTDK